MTITKSRKKRYAAKLLFQYRIVENGKSAKRWVCEERIIVFDSPSDLSAVRTANRKGGQAERTYRNLRGDLVAFEFVGVRGMIQLGIECDSDEVWYDIREMISPMERRSKLIPSDRHLLDPKYDERRRMHFLRLLAPDFLEEILSGEPTKGKPTERQTSAHRGKRIRERPNSSRS